MMIVKPRNPCCNDCGVLKTTENTYLRKRRLPGKLYFNSYCIACNMRRSLDWADSNMDRHKEIVKASQKRTYDPAKESVRNRIKYLKRRNK